MQIDRKNKNKNCLILLQSNRLHHSPQWVRLAHRSSTSSEDIDSLVPASAIGSPRLHNSTGPPRVVPSAAGPKPQIDTTPPASHTTPEDDACAATKQLLSTLLSYSHRDWDKVQRADALCDATRRYIQLGRPDPPPALFKITCPHTSGRRSPTSLTSSLKVAC